MVFYRVDVLENITDKLVELKVEPPLTWQADLNKDSVISIKPKGKEKVEAKRFSNRNTNPDRIVILHVYLDSKCTGRALTPSHLVNFSKIVFDKSRPCKARRSLLNQGFRLFGEELPREARRNLELKLED